MRIIFAAAFAVLLVAGGLHGQSTRGVLVGSVTDPSGGRVANAAVSVTDQATNSAVRTTTTQDGQYTVTNLEPGLYRVSVEAAGFKTAAVSGVTLNVNQTARVDVRLEVGELTTSVSVDASAPVVQSETTSIGSVVDNRQVQTMPLNGRGNMYSLLALAPGVVRSAQNPIVSASGVWFGSTNMTIDGSANIDFGNERLGPNTPSIDAVREFKVIGNGASAEFGRGGAQIVVATKSGTNELHGSLFAFNRNRALSAKNFFATHLPKPPFNRNEYGGTVGGPAIKDKLFYFGSFEGLRRVGSATFSMLQPTVAQKSGNFAGLAPIRDPLTGQPFPGNMIPQERIGNFARELLKFAPDPNTMGSFNYIFNSPTREINDRYLARADYNATGNDRFMARYWQANHGPYQDSLGGGTENYGNWGGFGDQARNFAASYTRLLSPAVVNEARFGFLQVRYFRLPQNADVDPSQFTPGLISPIEGLGGLPNVNIAQGYRGFSDVPGSGDRQRNYEFFDTLSWVRRRHALKAGFEIQRASAFNFSNLLPSRGQFDFDGRYTGNAFADFLLGYPWRTQKPTKNLEVEPKNTRWAAFFQDDWTVNSRVTLNLGLRYEYQGIFDNTLGEIANFDPATGRLVIIGGTPEPAFAGLPQVNGSELGLDRSNYLRRDRNNWAPRVGLAFRPLGNASLVIRTAYGIYYNVMPAYQAAQLPQNPPFRTVQLFEALPGNTPSLTMANPFPGTGSIPANPSVNAFARDRTTGYLQEWNFTVEGEVLRNTSLRASYVGSKGTHLDRNIAINDPVPAPGTIQPRRPYQPFGPIAYRESGRNSITQQIQLGAMRRFSSGLSFQLEYQYTNALSEQPFGITAPMDSFRAYLDRGHADFIPHHVMTANYTYDLPFGRGRVYALSGLADKLFGGWQLAGIVATGSGQPFSVTFDSTMTGWPSNRADVVGDPHLEDRGIARWFNTAAFAIPAPFTYGNSARNLLFGPGYFNWDTAVFKNTAITERVSLQFRAEFFNVLNHASFNPPAANISVPAQVGRITSTSNTPRDIQFGLRLLF
jgi:outer membrane receptor protein involved in Fe transport